MNVSVNNYNCAYHKNAKTKALNNDKTKEDNMVECTNLKINKNGGFLGYIDGEWKQLNKSSDDRTCGTNEILIKKKSKFSASCYWCQCFFNELLW